MMQRTLGKTEVLVGPIGYAERQHRREPGTAPEEGDLSVAAADERVQTVQAALDAGISLFHAAHEREAASLGASLRALGVRDAIVLSTTDGDALDRCPDTEAGGAAAIHGALIRKIELLGTDTIDLFLLYDFRGEAHTPARLSGTIQALEDARQAGLIRFIGTTCYGEYDTLAEVIDSGRWQPNLVLARYNYWDQRAAARLFPACRERGVGILAAQPFAWIGGVPFVRFPNTWRCRNLTRSFYGFTAA